MIEEKKLTYSDKPWLKSYKVGAYKLPHTMEPYPEISVYKFLENSAKKYPKNTALVYLDEEITYAQLKLLSDKLATALADLGVKKYDKIATILPNCIQFVICDYAIMRLGAIHVPLSILHKAPDLIHEFAQSEAETVICSYRRLERVNSIKEKTKIKRIIYTPTKIFPDYSLPKMKPMSNTYRLEDLIEKNEPNPPIVKINPKDDLAMIPFTGGTTGLPKGTMQTHYNITTNVVQTLHWMMKPLESAVKGKTSFMINVPIFHQYGHWALTACISWGLRVFIMDPRDIDRMVEIIKKYRPFMTIGVPTHYILLLKKDLKRIPKFFFSAAAPLPDEIADQFEKKIGIPMGEGYGATETTGGTHLNLTALSKITGFMSRAKKGIGIPVPDTDVKIIDPDTNEEVPIGESGEFWVRGPQVMKGYWPEKGKGLTKDGWLPMGDIGKMDEDGYFYIVDRIKDMINISGMKVYSRIVEDVLYKYPPIKKAGVIGIPDPERPGSERIKAFISLKDEFREKTKPQEIIEFCRENLPPYAVPKFIEFREELPMTPVMKMFKRKLREEETARMKANGEVK